MKRIGPELLIFVESLYCGTETNITLYVNYNGI